MPVRLHQLFTLGTGAQTGQVVKTDVPRNVAGTPSAPTATPTSPSAEPNLLSFRPDTSVMYLPNPHGVRGPKLLLQALAEVRSSARSQRAKSAIEDQVRQRRLRQRELDYAKRLCRVISPEDWSLLLELFLEALLEGLEQPSFKSTHADAPPGWALAPWFSMDVADFDEPGTLLPALEHASLLGFTNVAATGHLDAKLLGEAAARARALDLHLITDLDLRRTLSRSDFGLVFREVLYEMRAGVVGRRSRGVDAWLDDERQGHALHALIKLFLRILDQSEVLVSDLESGEHDISEYTGGGIDIRGSKTTTESDLVPWFDAGLAIEQALSEQCGAPLEALLERPLEVLHGADRSCALEFVPPTSFQGAAFACLYALPATPVVHVRQVFVGPHAISRARLEVGSEASTEPQRTLRAWNAARASGPWAERPRVIHADPRVAVWLRPEANAAHASIINLSSERAKIRVRRARVAEVFGAKFAAGGDWSIDLAPYESCIRVLR